MNFLSFRSYYEVENGKFLFSCISKKYIPYVCEFSNSNITRLQILLVKMFLRMVKGNVCVIAMGKYLDRARRWRRDFYDGVFVLYKPSPPPHLHVINYYCLLVGIDVFPWLSEWITSDWIIVCISISPKWVGAVIDGSWKFCPYFTYSM